MREKYTILNSVMGLSYRLLCLLSGFLVRYFFVRYISKEYLGLEGLFSNIIGIFSLIDLGFGTAIGFSLYKPINENDEEMVSSIMQLFKKVYICIGLAIMGLSLASTPFLPYFIKGSSLSGDYIKVAFLIYAAGTSVSYFVSYKRTMIFAIQKNYISLIVDSIFKLLCTLLQIIVLINLKNYLLYLIIIAISNFGANFVVALICDANKYFDKRKAKKLSKEYTNNLKRDIKALMVTNICGKGITSTDNLLISSMIGVIELAKNANYSMIINALQLLIISLLGGAEASIGDLIAEGNINKINVYFNRYAFIYGIFASFCSLGFFFLIDPFIKLWVGPDFLFSLSIKFVLASNLYLILMMKPIAVFQNYGGLYVIYQPISISAVIINLFFSVLLAIYTNIFGIFLGTSLSYLFQVYAFNRLLHIHLLKRKPKKYWIMQLKILILTIICAFILYTTQAFSFQNAYINMIYIFTKLIFSFILFVVIIFKKNDEYKYFKNIFFVRLKSKLKIK